MPKKFLLWFCLMPGLWGTNVNAQLPDAKDYSDRIIHFHSDLDVRKNGDILVTETITIFNGDGTATPGYGAGSYYNNNDIQRGIVRDFPTKYADSLGYWYETGFSVQSVTKNGIAEPYSIEGLDNGKRLKIGRAEIILTPGFYTYRIVYITNRQLIYHPDKDELYWNVNGNGWVFTTDTASCTIHFPDDAVVKEYACYTGAKGSTASDCTGKQTQKNSVSFITTKGMNSYEGLTVAVAIEKNVLVAPGAARNAAAFLRANYIIPLLSFLLLVLLTYYFFVWKRSGVDPRKGIIYPQFSPPAGITPADAGYIVDQKFTPHLFAAALIDCAVKKQLQIVVTREGLVFKSNVYSFNKPPDLKTHSDVSGEYGFSLTTLYGEQAKKGTYNSTLRTCYLGLQSKLKERFLIRRGKKNQFEGLFVLNKGYVILGLIIFIVSVVLTFQFFATHSSLRMAVISVIFLVAMLITHLIFRRIMSAYTKKGREIADHLLGFKMYLAQAEQLVYNQLAPPEKTLELFEKYLPYAVALQVENAWAEKFSGIMQKALAEGYQPSYYSMMGTHGAFSGMSDFSSGLSSGLSNTISSASTPPSSSGGGSGGGGSSGGGGGGGGGGGW